MWLSGIRIKDRRLDSTAFNHVRQMANLSLSFVELVSSPTSPWLCRFPRFTQIDLNFSIKNQLLVDRRWSYEWKKEFPLQVHCIEIVIEQQSSLFTTTASPSTFFNLNSLLEEDFENICIIKSRSIRARASRHAVANVLRDKNETFWYRSKIDGHFGKVEAKKRLQRSLLARNC